MQAIKRKLERDILPYLESAERLTSWTPFRLYALYFWLGELFVLLVGLGISHPALRLLAAKTPEATSTASNAPIIATLGEGILFWIALIGLLAWGLLKIYVVRNDLERRCSLIRSNLKHFRQVRVQLTASLRNPNPMEELLKIQEDIGETLNRMLGEEAWPWTRELAPDIERVVKIEVERYLTAYADGWTGVPETADVQQLGV